MLMGGRFWERYGVDQIWLGIQSGVAGRAGGEGVAVVEVFVSHAGATGQGQSGWPGSWTVPGYRWS